MTVEAPLSAAEAYFRSHVLWPEEKILWTGRPGLRRSLVFNWWFCPVGLIMVLFLAMLYVTTPEITDIRLPELLIIAGALWLLLSPLRYAWRARRTAYFVTDQRAAILRKGLWRVQETVFFAPDITDFKVIRGRGGRGDIRLRVSKSRLRNAYQEDKEKLLPGAGGGLSSFAGVGPFVMYTDGFWGAENIALAATALKNLPPADVKSGYR